MKAKLFLFVVAGFMFSMISCKNHLNDETIPDENLYDEKSSDAKSTKEESSNKEESKNIDFLLEIVPVYIKEGFYEKFNEWIAAVNKSPEMGIHSNPLMWAKIEEYDSLLNYCKNYGKAIWPLLNKIAENPFSAALLRDLTTTDGKVDYLSVLNLVPGYVPGGLFPSSMELRIAYCKQLLEKEYDNILKAIQDIIEKDNEKQT